MKKPSQALLALTDSIEKKVRQIFQEGLGYEVNSVSCRLVGERDFIISVERSLSATEKFLIKEDQSVIAQEMGLLINVILKDRLFLVLLSDLNIDVADVSTLQPASPEQLNLFVLTNRPQGDSQPASQHDRFDRSLERLR